MAFCCNSAHLESRPLVLPQGGSVLSAVSIRFQSAGADLRARSLAASVFCSASSEGKRSLNRSLLVL